MNEQAAFLKTAGEALLNAAGAGITDDSIVDVLPDVIRTIWNQWGERRDQSRLKAEIEALVQASTREIRQAINQVIQDIGTGQPDNVRAALGAYLRQIPPTIRHWFRRPADPTGTTYPTARSLNKAEDLLPFLPIRLPRFKPGDSPLMGVDWQLEELLGVGGFGEVWKARNPNLSSASAVALKFCLDPPSAKVLRNEARLLDRLMLQGKHPGIVALRQTYLNAEPPCLEYEYIAGGDFAGMIHDWHRNGQGPTPLHAAQVMRRLARIVAFAHELDPPIVHRDLKPANILVQSTGDGKFAFRIADFGNGGVAASHAIRQTLHGTSQAQLLVSAVRGACTPLYASPQQMRGSDADPRDDVYALGVIWYQLLTGDLSTGRPGGTRWTKRLTDLGMPLPLVELLGSCFEDNPADRPRNAAALLEQITSLLQAGDPGSASVLVDDLASEPRSTWPRRITNSINLTMMLIPGGTFRMGSSPAEPERSSDEGPQHEVTITQPFYMGIYPVTQRQYEVVMGRNPAAFNATKGGGPDFPVESISWDEAIEFCRRLSALTAEKEAGRTYRLPTEAEWEYACRGGIPMPFTSGLTLTSREANFNGNYPYGMVGRGPYLEHPSKVGSYPPNPFGLYDMHGNVWEWCADYYDRTYYRNSPRYDPPGAPTGTLRVVRGGSCFNIGRFCRSAYRFGVTPGNRDIDVGMRVVMMPVPSVAHP